jgi:hypothetical protein
MANLNADYWEGYRDALNLFGIEVDKIMKTGYNDRRSQNDLLDLKVKIRELLSYDETMATNL